MADERPPRQGQTTSGFEHPVEPQFEEFDLRSTLLVLRRRAGVILGILILGTAAAILAAALLPKQYTATSEVLITPPQGSRLNFEEGREMMRIESGYVDSQVEILGSRSLMERVASELALFDDPEFNPPEDKSRSFLASLDPREWLGFLGDDSTRDQALAPEEAERVGVIDALTANTSARREGLSFLIEVSATSRSPRKAARIANKVVDLYLVDQLDWRMESLKRTNEWLSTQIDQLRDDLVASEKAAEMFRARNNLLEVSGDTLNEEQRSKINAQLMLAQADLAEKEARYQGLQKLLSSTGTAKKIAEVLSSEHMAELRQQRAKLASAQAELASRYGERHPKMVNIRAELRDVEQQIEAEANRIVENLRNEVAVARTRVRSLEKSLEKLDQEAAQNQQAAVQLRDLERQVEANRQLYESLLAGFKKSVALTGSNSLEPTARSVSSAVPPSGPSFPSMRLFAAIGFVLSGLTGLGAAFLLEALDNGFRTGNQIEQKLGIPHISSIPTISKKDLRNAKVTTFHDYILKKPLSSFSEAHHKLKTALDLANVDRPPKLVLVTSSLPGEGKTTASACLARMVARSGQKTLLIDADLRHPNIHTLFSLKAEHGLVDVLQRRVSTDEAIVMEEATGLRLLLNESTPANPADLLASESMETVLRACRAAYDLVILDSAPVLPVADTSALAKRADTTIFFVQWEKTPRSAAENALKTLLEYGGHVTGAAFTMLDLKSQARHGYGDSYYYYRRYSDYYAD